MKLILALLFASTLGAQTIWQIPLWNGQRYEWPTLGPSFVIVGGVVDVLPAPAVRVHRHSGTVILTATGGVYNIPAAATNLALYRNGLRQAPGIDYDLKAGVITTLFAWGAGNLVVADYEIP